MLDKFGRLLILPEHNDFIRQPHRRRRLPPLHRQRHGHPHLCQHSRPQLLRVSKNKCAFYFIFEDFRSLKMNHTSSQGTTTSTTAVSLSPGGIQTVNLPISKFTIAGMQYVTAVLTDTVLNAVVASYSYGYQKKKIAFRIFRISTPPRFIFLMA